MKQNKDTLIRLIKEYHQKVDHYKLIEADYIRLKLLESRIETITVEKTVPSEDVMDELITERVWKGIVAEMGANIAQMLLEGSGLHVQQDFIFNHFGGSDLRMITQFKFIKTMGSKTFGENNY